MRYVPAQAGSVRRWSGGDHREDHLSSTRHLIAVGVVLQAATIAFAWFDVIAAVEGGQPYADHEDGNAGHALHGFLGMTLIPLVALGLLVVAFFAKLPDGIKWAAIVFGVTLLQVVLAFVGFAAPIIGALHGVNALVLAIVAGKAAAAAGGSETTAEGSVEERRMSPARARSARNRCSNNQPECCGHALSMPGVGLYPR